MKVYPGLACMSSDELTEVRNAINEELASREREEINRKSASLAASLKEVLRSGFAVGICIGLSDRDNLAIGPEDADNLVVEVFPVN